MKLFTNPLNWFRKEKGTVVLSPTVVQRSPWRNNMWVMTPDGVGIVFDLREPVLVHIVNTIDGTTKYAKEFSSSELRQAKWLEIPANRRGDPEKAKRLGYE